MKIFRMPVEPRCPTHGQMHFNFPADRYECRGFDGEGCEYIVNMEDVPIEYFGTVDNVEWRWSGPLWGRLPSVMGGDYGKLS